MIKEVFVDRDNSVFSAPVLCFCSRKKPGEHITETLADSVSNVKLCGGGVKYCLSSTCTVHVLQCVFITVHSIILHTCSYSNLVLLFPSAYNVHIVLQWSQYETVYVHLVYENV